MVSPENSAIAVFGENVLINELDDEVSTLEVPVSNEGEVELVGKIAVAYELPAIYTDRNISKAPANVKIKCANRAVKASETHADDVAYVLHYDRGQVSAVSVGNYTTAIFGQSYASELMAAVKGMTIECIDAYIESVPTKAVAQIYEKDGDSYVVVAEKEFTPAAKSWNHITLDEPYIITGKEIIYAVKIEGMLASKFYMGIIAVR